VDPVPPPHRTEKDPEMVDLLGKFLPCQMGDDRSAVLLSMPGTEDRYVPVFSALDDLVAIMERLGFGGGEYDAVTVTDGRELLASIPLATPEGARVHIIIDPHFLENGKVRFTQVFRGNECH